jgi:hypothetical protein
MMMPTIVAADNENAKARKSHMQKSPKGSSFIVSHSINDDGALYFQPHFGLAAGTCVRGQALHHARWAWDVDALSL